MKKQCQVLLRKNGREVNGKMQFDLIQCENATQYEDVENENDVLCCDHSHQFAVEAECETPQEHFKMIK